MRRPGDYLIDAAERLILDILESHEDGLTNQEIGELSGLNPWIKTQNGYVTWTILAHLIQNGKVRKDERRYILIR